MVTIPRLIEIKAKMPYKHLSVAGDKSSAWLKLSGLEGAQDFIKTELGL